MPEIDAAADILAAELKKQRAGYIEARAPTRFGPTRMKRRSCNWRPNIYTSRSCSPFGRDSDRVISCGCPGPPMTGLAFGCGNQRAVCKS